MFIFRFEHNRDVCFDPKYAAGSDSPTGHGIASGCGPYSSPSVERPNFGHRGSPPMSIMTHERCAVTAQQFSDWISDAVDYQCRDTDPRCDSYSMWCQYCPPNIRKGLGIPEGWDIISYWVHDDAEGIDWRFDSNQVVFNPERATLIGPVTLAHVEKVAGREIKVMEFA